MHDSEKQVCLFLLQEVQYAEKLFYRWRFNFSFGGATFPDCNKVHILHHHLITFANEITDKRHEVVIISFAIHSNRLHWNHC